LEKKAQTPGAPNQNLKKFFPPILPHKILGETGPLKNRGFFGERPPMGVSPKGVWEKPPPSLHRVFY